jgi:hypothetical protein
MAHNENITLEKKEVIRNLYLSGIGEEFIAMQLDIEIPDVIKVLMSINLQIDIWFTHVYPWYNYFQIKFQIQRVL